MKPSKEAFTSAVRQQSARPQAKPSSTLAGTVASQRHFRSPTAATRSPGLFGPEGLPPGPLPPEADLPNIQLASTAAARAGAAARSSRDSFCTF